MKRLICTTGCASKHLPAGDAGEELLALVRIGLKFRAQHTGKRPGFLHRYIAGLVAARAGRMSFADLLLELGYQARRRELLGELESPVERVDVEWALMTYHCPARGRCQVTFKRLENLLTAVKKGNPDNP